MFEFKLLFLWRGLGGGGVFHWRERGMYSNGTGEVGGGDDAAAHLPPPLPPYPPLTYATSEKGMLSELCIKKPKGVQFAGRRKVFCRQKFAAFLHRDRVRLETPQNWAAGAQRATHTPTKHKGTEEALRWVTEEERRKGERVRVCVRERDWDRDPISLSQLRFSADRVQRLATGKRSHFWGVFSSSFLSFYSG